jgi:hypothetical protein
LEAACPLKAGNLLIACFKQGKNRFWKMKNFRAPSLAAFISREL